MSVVVNKLAEALIFATSLDAVAYQKQSGVVQTATRLMIHGFVSLQAAYDGNSDDFLTDVPDAIDLFPYAKTKVVGTTYEAVSFSKLVAMVADAFTEVDMDSLKGNKQVRSLVSRMVKELDRFTAEDTE